MKKLVVLAALPALFGCATVVRGTKDTAKFESEPAGATVVVESISADKLGPYTCVTPCELELKRKREWKVEFALDGYKPVTGTLQPKVTGGGVASGAGNVIAGGIIGIGVDAGTGANLDLRPNPMKAKLAANDAREASLIVIDENDSKKKAKDSKAIAGQKAAPADAAAPSVAPTDETEKLAPDDAPLAETTPSVEAPLTMDPVDSPPPAEEAGNAPASQ